MEGTAKAGNGIPQRKCAVQIFFLAGARCLSAGHHLRLTRGPAGKKCAAQKSEENQSEQMEYRTKLYKENPGSMSKKIQSLSSKVIHLNLSRSAASPPLTWRTACRWNYDGSDFVFTDPETEVSCQKCRKLCAKTQ